MRVFLDTGALIALSGLTGMPANDYATDLRNFGVVLCVGHIQVDEKVDREMRDYDERTNKAVRELRDLDLKISLEPTGLIVSDVSRSNMAKFGGEEESALYHRLLDSISTCNSATGKKSDATRDAIIGVSALDHDLFVVCDECLFHSFQFATRAPEISRNRVPKIVYAEPTLVSVADGILRSLTECRKDDRGHNPN